jgi:predicted amidohydrolase YtcJ
VNGRVLIERPAQIKGNVMNTLSAHDLLLDSPDITVYINGKVLTVDDDFSIAQEFAVRSGRIVAVGNDLGLAESANRVVDLKGRLVLPGFIDSHCHVVFRAMERLANPNLEGLSSIHDISAAIRKAAVTRGPGVWILTSPIGDRPDHFGLPESLAERRWLTRQELDDAAPLNPVYIPSPTAWPHPALFNSQALALLGIDRDTRDSDGVIIEREPATGEPTGLVFGLSIYNSSPLKQRLQGLLPQDSLRDLRDAVLGAIDENLSVGVTSIYEGHMNTMVPLLADIHAAGLLKNRVVSAYEVPVTLPLAEIEDWFHEKADARGSGAGDDEFKVVGVTAALDGAIQFGKAWMRQPYRNPFGNLDNGASAVSVEKLTAIARIAIRHDTRLNILAAGSAAIDMTMEALRAVDSETPLRGRDWVVQHFQHPTKDQIAELVDFGMIAQTYSSVDYSKGALVYQDRVDGDIWESTVPLRWWIDGGMVIAQGSDAAHFNPLFQIWESLVRVDGRTGESLMAPPKSVIREEAIRLYTRNGASVLQWQDRIGSIEAGKYADFVVLDRDILACEVDDIRDARVLATCVAGEARYDPSGLLGFEQPTGQHEEA